jgi:hypothetical protein
MPQGPGVQRIEVDFDDPVTLTAGAAGNVVVEGRTTSYPGGVATLGPIVTYTPAGVSLVDVNTVAITFTPFQLPDETCYRIDVGNGVIVQTIDDDDDVSVRSLAGDATGDGTVTLSDALYIKSHVGQAVAPDRIRSDIDLSGGSQITLNDALTAKSRVASPARRALCP